MPPWQVERREAELSKIDPAILRNLRAGGCPLPFDQDCIPEVGGGAVGLAVRPKRGGALLFYSQEGDGALDWNSRHGGCPVWDTRHPDSEEVNPVVKYGANVWVWNGPS